MKLEANFNGERVAAIETAIRKDIAGRGDKSWRSGGAVLEWLLDVGRAELDRLDALKGERT